jgi:hypothetical protein
MNILTHANGGQQQQCFSEYFDTCQWRPVTAMFFLNILTHANGGQQQQYFF